MRDKLNIKFLANTDQKREKGLMFTDSISQNDCAFFVFESACKPGFWNKNVRFDIDVAFFNENGDFLSVKGLNAHQEEPIVGEKKTKYVIETNRGWFEKNGITKKTNLWDLINLESLRDEREI